MPAGHEIVGEPALRVETGIRLGDDVLPFLDCGQVLDLVGDEAIEDLAVRGLQETVLVGPGVDCEGVDESDVRTLRRLDRTDPSVVGRMHVPHFEACPFPREAAGAEGRNPPLVRNLGKRVVLVHELG